MNCVVELIPKAIFNRQNPIIIGVKVVSDVPLNIGTVLHYQNILLGPVTVIEKNHQNKLNAKTNQTVAISINSNVKFENDYRFLHA